MLSKKNLEAAHGNSTNVEIDGTLISYRPTQMRYSNPSRIINCRSLKTKQVDADTQIKYLEKIISDILFSNNGSEKSYSSYNSSDVATESVT